MNNLKKAFLALFVLATTTLALNGTAYAWWSANAKIYVNSTVVKAQVVNSTPRPMYCRGYVYGRTYYGTVLSNYSEGWVQPGSWAYIYVHTNSNDRFVRGWANVQCRF